MVSQTCGSILKSRELSYELEPANYFDFSIKKCNYKSLGTS